LSWTPDALTRLLFTGDSFDMAGERAQTLGLAIDPYAEGPGEPPTPRARAADHCVR
jgi:hypothetical protein